MPLSRRALLRNAALSAVALAVPSSLAACTGSEASLDSRDEPSSRDPVSDPDRDRLLAWTAVLRREQLVEGGVPLGRAAARVGELAAGTPYEAFTLEAYLREGGSPSRTEPLTLSLTRFDCVSLVEACLAVARVANADATPTWERFGAEMERMRYRGGVRRAYDSRLHYFSEWIADGASRGLLRDLGADLGGEADRRPLRFMGEHPDSYPALADPEVLEEIRAMERRLDDSPRMVVPTARIPLVSGQIESGDILAFATSIPGLDVTHSAFAYRGEDAVLRVLHAPLSGGVVEVTGATLPEYVAGIRSATGILVARPMPD
ncbi:MAG TPA: N-acetylmuramoyl-L-alanine amidase-like domain-containing protein [Gemmatimonadaceae bacterium]|nr:N-acetylmuramoyl-L-alanine amidase-like domain-containing protein [Gemmatimonadaceae bacterium]